MRDQISAHLMLSAGLSTATATAYSAALGHGTPVHGRSAAAQAGVVDLAARSCPSRVDVRRPRQDAADVVGELPDAPVQSLKPASAVKKVVKKVGAMRKRVEKRLGR